MPNLSLLLLQVMMMVLPLLIIVLLPKVVNTNDPEMRKVSNPHVLFQKYCTYSEVIIQFLWNLLVYSDLFYENELIETQIQK